LAVLFLLAPAPASARRPHPPAAAPDGKTHDEAAQERAQEALRAGHAALAARDLAGAYEKAADSFRTLPSAAALHLLGRVALAEGRTLAAQDLLRRYLADPDLEPDDNSVEQAEARRVSELPQEGSGQLKILGDSGTLVLVDERLVGALPLSRPLLVAAGSHKVELRRGPSRLQDEVRVLEGRMAELRIDVGKAAFISSILPGVVLYDEPSPLDAQPLRRMLRALELAVEAERLSPLLRERVVQAAGEPPPGPCPEGERCMLGLAERSQADYLLRLRISDIKQPAGFEFSLELFDVEIGAAAASESQSCTGCTLDEAGKKLAAMFAPLYKRALGRPRGRISVKSEPAGATVTLDGRRLGETPLDRPVFAGPGSLTLKKDGYRDVIEETTIPEGETARLSLQLPLLPEPPPPALTPPPAPPPVVKKELPRPLWRLITGSVAVAGGLFAVGIGAAAIVVDGHCAEPFDLSIATTPPGCTAKYDGTRPLGIGLVSAGSALVLGGTLLLALPRRR
jgi:hypothetical protein